MQRMALLLTFLLWSACAQAADLVDTLSTQGPISNKTFDSTNTYNGGTFNNQSLGSPSITGTVSGSATYATPTLTQPILTSPTLSGTVSGGATYSPLNVQTSTEAGLPAAGTAGRLVWVTDGPRGLWGDFGTKLANLFGYDWLADSYTDFNAALTAIGSTEATIVVGKAATVSATVTAPCTLKIARAGQGYLTSSGSQVLTICSPGHIDAPAVQIFAGALATAGNVLFTRPGTVYPEWWGGAGDNTTDNQASTKAAIWSLPQSGANIGGEVFWNGGTYLYLTTDGTETSGIIPLCGKQNIRLTGTGNASFLYSTLNNTFIIASTAGCSTTAHNIEIDHLKFGGDQPGNVMPPVKSSQSTVSFNLGSVADAIHGLKIHDVYFDKRYFGVSVGPGSQNVEIHHNTFNDMHAGIATTGADSVPTSKNLKFNFNVFTYSSVNRVGDDAIAIFWPVEDVEVIGNVVDRRCTSATTVQCSTRIVLENNGTLSSSTATHITFAFNTVKNAGWYPGAAGPPGRSAIGIYGNNTNAATTQAVKVIGNIMDTVYTCINVNAWDANNPGFDDVLIESNTCRNATAGGFAFVGGTRMKLARNRILNYDLSATGNHAIAVTSATLSSDYTYEFNEILGSASSGSGIFMSGTTGGSLRTSIKGGSIVSAGARGIYLFDVNDAEISGVTIDAPALVGILADATTSISRLVIRDTRLLNIGTASTQDGVQINKPTTDLQLVNNFVKGSYNCYDFQAANANVLVVGNKCANNGHQGFAFAGTNVTMDANQATSSGDRCFAANAAVTSLTFTGNTAQACGNTGMVLVNLSANQTTISANTSTGNTGDGMLVQGATGALISTNTLTGNSGYGLNLNPASPTISSVVTENNVTGNTTAAVNYNPANNTAIHFRSNLGWVTENSGTGTIASGSTSITIAHGLAVTPTAQQVSITQTATTTNLVSAVWVDTCGATTCTVHVNTDPGASGFAFGWAAVVIP